MEPKHPLQASTRRSVDQQANRGARSDHGATINPRRMSGSQGVTSFLKVTGAQVLETTRDHAGHRMRQRHSELPSGG